MSNNFIKENFTNYAGAVIQNRAIPEVVDGLKPGARQILYCMYTDKFVHGKPYQKTLKAIGSAARIFWHGDASCLWVIMRNAQPFATRYPLVEVEGNMGNLQERANYAAPRYTSARLTSLANYLFKDIEKNTISEWRDNYDDTEQYPVYLPCKGFAPIVNGTLGIGVSMGSGIPPTNLREVNSALVKLLWNPDIDDDEIICMPDFPTGATVLNGSQVREAMKNGHGKACKVRSTIEYDKANNCLVVTEIPYITYVNTICAQLEDIINEEDGKVNPGIDRFNDLTGLTPKLKIYLTKNANVNKVVKYLYKNTSLQNHYGINFNMLEKGRYPRDYTWKQMLQAHLDHEMEVYARAFQFDVDRIKERLHIIEGLVLAINNIDEVITTIKSANSTSDAQTKLMTLLSIDSAQAQAILKITLSRLAKMETNKLLDEQSTLISKKNEIEAILNDTNLLKKEVEKGLNEVAAKFGDERRTKIIDLNTQEDEEVEQFNFIVSLTNENRLFTTKETSLYAQKRGARGRKIKLSENETVIGSASCDSKNPLMFVSNKGKAFFTTVNELNLEDFNYCESLFGLQEREVIVQVIDINSKNLQKFLVFFTANGLIKKTAISELMKSTQAKKCIELEDGDSLVGIDVVEDEKVGFLSSNGNLMITNSSQVRASGRSARGVKGMKVDDGVVVRGRSCKQDTIEIVTISKNGKISRTPMGDFKVTGTNTKGLRAQKLKDGDSMVDFLPITKSDKELIVATSTNQVKMQISEIPLSSRGTVGVIATDLKNSQVIELVKICN